MVAPWVIPAISAGSQLLGSIGGLFSDSGPGPGEQAETQLIWQKKAAREMPSAMVKGAELAGLHPLAVLGMGGMSAPVMQFGESGPSLGERLGEMGQGVSRAASIVQSASEKGLEQTMAKLQVRNMELQNARIASEINLMNQPASPPALPTLQRGSFEGYAAADDVRHSSAVLRGDSRYRSPTGSQQWTEPTLRQMESDYLRVPIEYLRAAYEDLIAEPGQRYGRRLRGLFSK